ncbi:MAG: phosphomannose isomerase type II C-terminal cupin domain [Minisyncoccia bacterium]
MDVDLPHRRRDERPWGGFEQFTENESSTVKIISVRPDEMFSLQTHAHRDEFWRILSGNGTVTVGANRASAEAGDEFWIPRGEQHRAQGGRDGPLQFLEIAFGDFDESDIVRLEDKYGRA